MLPKSNADLLWKLTLSSSGGESHHSARFERRQTAFFMHKTNTERNTPRFQPPCLLRGWEAFVVQVCWIYTPFTSPFLLLICYLPPPPSHTLSPLLFFLWWSGLSGRWLSVSAGSPSTVILRIVKHLGRTCSVNTHVDEWLTHSLYLCMLTLVSIFQLLLAVSL